MTIAFACTVDPAAYWPPSAMVGGFLAFVAFVFWVAMRHK